MQVIIIRRNVFLKIMIIIKIFLYYAFRNKHQDIRVWFEECFRSEVSFVCWDKKA